MGNLVVFWTGPDSPVKAEAAYSLASSCITIQMENPTEKTATPMDAKSAMNDILLFLSLNNNAGCHMKHSYGSKPQRLY
jgi:hypothetical protein